ncbi:Cof-type HAD-IIB family hydrolase [Streptococcus dentapri]|uniref:Cof-type HAD-IIB family hydrolase n=1 Tax=Streptococcus dentapri TaxID=573564 RepID=A0ABV8D035_9STRE
MPDIKLVATDMDGTFLQEDGSFDEERLHRLLRAYKRQGKLFTVASGRSMLALKKIFAGFEHDMAFVAENGSFVQYDGQVLFEAQMDEAFYMRIAQQLDVLPDMTGYLLSGRKGAYTLESSSPDYIEFVKHYYENVQPVDSLADLDDDIFKITVNFTQKTVADRESWLNEHLSGAIALTTGFKSVDIILLDVDKSTGLKSMCQELGIEASQVIAFGDNMNDYQMMQFAGTAIATANARQEIKDLANEVIGHCNDQAVISYMEGLIE